MTHYRETIRTVLVDRISNLPGQSDDPIDSVDFIISENHLPASSYEFSEEIVEGRSVATPDSTTALRVLTVSLAIYSESPTELEELAAEVESRMKIPIATGVHHDLIVTRFENPRRGSREFFSLALDYEITYKLEDGVPDRIYC